MFTVESHVYDAEKNVDHYVFNPGGLKALVKIIEKDGEPEVLLGVMPTTNQLEETEIAWTVCSNKIIADIALKDYAERQ